MVESMRTVVFGAAFGLVLGCGRANWGGPKAPPPEKAPVPTASQAPGGFVFDSSLRSSPSPSRDAGAMAVPHIEGSLAGGKIPAYEETVIGIRPSLKACVENKGEPDAVVEITAKIGPKGNVTGTDAIGGTQFLEGAVPCLTKKIEAATFRKPTEGSPRVTFRVTMRRE